MHPTLSDEQATLVFQVKVSTILWQKKTTDSIVLNMGARDNCGHGSSIERRNHHYMRHFPLDDLVMSSIQDYRHPNKLLE